MDDLTRWTQAYLRFRKLIGGLALDDALRVLNALSIEIYSGYVDYPPDWAVGVGEQYREMTEIVALH